MPSAAATSPHPTPARAVPRAWLGAGVIAAAVLVAYHNTFSVPFLLDDLFSINENESVHGIGAWWTVFSPRAQVYTAGRPLLNFSFALNYALGELSVTGYHVVNLLIHLGAALTLWALVRRTLARHAPDTRGAAEANRVALLAALLWALHPVQTVCVTYVSQRAESLMALCYLLTLFGFVRASETSAWRWRILTVASCVAGMMTKEVMATAPVLVLLFDAMFLSDSFRGAWRARKGLHLSLAATWLVLLALMLGTRVGARGVGFGFQVGWFDYLRIESATVLHYLRLAVWPSSLVFDYGQEMPVPGALAFTVNVLVLGALAAGILLAVRRRSALGFLGCWFFLILAPTSSIVPVAGQPIAENRMYLPLAAVAVLGAGLLRQAGPRTGAALLAVVLAFGALSVARNRVYGSEVAIWADTAAKRPGSSRAHLNYGTALGRAKRTGESMREFENALQINPGYATVHSALACAYFEHGRYDEAIRHFQIAVANDPLDPMTRSNFGATLFHVGRIEESLQQFLEALRIRPTHAPSRVNTGILLARVGRPDEAIAMFEETLRMYPHDASAREQLAQLRAALQSGSYQFPRRAP